MAKKYINRRNFLQQASAASMLGMNLGCEQKQEEEVVVVEGSKDSATAAVGAPKKPKFLFVYTATGGASIQDCFLPVKESESSNFRNINAFPDNWVKTIEGTELRAVDMAMEEIGPLPFPVRTVQSHFLNKYKDDTMVVTLENSSVSHPIGQKRSITGYDAWNGRTLQEAVAAQYGSNLLMPNVNMAEGGFAEHGSDISLPARAKAEFIKNPLFLPFGFHGSKGVRGAPGQELIDIARRFRSERLDPSSKFFKSFSANARIQRWLQQRERNRHIESFDLINKLNPFEDTQDFPFGQFGLEPNDKGAILRDVFDNIGADPIQTQALMAYLLVTNGISNAVTFGPGMNVIIDGRDADEPLITNTPSGFDYTHNAHRGAQAVCWHQCLDTIDRLISLLKRTHLENGESYWDHSLIYIATEHGKDQERQDGESEFTSGHNVNNGAVIISPLVNGGRVLGGVDPETCMTYGFDPLTGAPDKGRTMTEAEIYSGILQALGIETPGANLPDMKAMLKKA